MIYARTALGILVIVVAIWIIVAEQMSGASADATINARLVTLRAPVAGDISQPPRNLGSMVERGEIIATVRDTLVDGMRLDDLAIELSIVTASVARLSGVVAETRAAMQRLEDRTELYREGRIAELETRLAYARERLELLEAGVSPAVPDADVGPALDEVGPGQPVDQGWSELWINSAEEQVETLEIALRAARSGVFLGDGYNDAPYAEQRLTELASELAAQEAQLAEAEAVQAAYEARESAELRRVNRFGGAQLVAPVRGFFWEVLAADGEAVQRGDPVARLLDCDSTIVTLSVTEGVFNRLSAGDEAVFRPRGTRDTFEGTVVRLAGAGAATVYRNLAVAPSQRHLERHDITLSVPGLRADPEFSCAIGRTGRVYFDARPLDRLREFLQ